MAASNNETGGIGFLGLLAIVFIILKLTKIIFWSWWWVLSPVWMPMTIVLSIATLVSVGYLSIGFIRSK